MPYSTISCVCAFHFPHVLTAVCDPLQAEASISQSQIILGETLTLSGTLNTGLTYSWSYTWVVQSAPTGSKASLFNPFGPQTTFQPDIAGNYVFQLTVSDACSTAVSTVSVSVSCARQSFSAAMQQDSFTSTWQVATRQFQCVRMQANLLQYGSYNASGALHYDWTVLAAPVGSVYEPRTLPVRRQVIGSSSASTLLVGSMNTTNTTTYRTTFRYTMRNSTVRLNSSIAGMASLIPDKPGTYSGMKLRFALFR